MPFPWRGGPATREPLTAAQLLELEEAWAELAAAQEASELTNFHACTRTDRPWTEDPAAVRAVAAALREFPHRKPSRQGSSGRPDAGWRQAPRRSKSPARAGPR